MECVKGIEMLVMDDFDGLGRKSDIWADDVFQPDHGFEDSDELLTDLSVGTNNKNSHD